MSETENVRDAEGKFLPGNPLWKIGAFKPGHPGLRPNKFTPEEAFHRIANYFDNQADRKRPPTPSGIRLCLGIFNRETFNKYRKGEYGKTADDRRAYADVFDWASLVIETYCEEELLRTTGQVQGITKMLENKYGWRDVRHLAVESREVTHLVIEVSPALAEKLAGKQRIEKVIEGEIV